MKSFVLCLFSLFFFAVPALAETSFQFTAPGLRSPDDPNVNGFRFSLLHGKAKSVSGFDLGLASISESTNTSGFAAILGVAMVTGKSSGFSGALLNINSGESTGVNGAFVNSVKTVKKGGVNIGFLNITEGFSATDISGLAISNESNVQVGFVNVTKKINKLQIGIMNVADNGFFPVFPFFNYPKK